MSFSFQVRVKTKDEAKASCASQMATIVAGQPPHAIDEQLVVTLCGAYIDLLADNPDKEIQMYVSGSLGGTWLDGNLTDVSTATVNVQASLQDPI